MCYILSVLGGFMLAGTFGLAQGKVGTESLAQIKKETRIFESIVQEVLKQHFTHPYALAGEPNASYLKGYGVSVTFHLRINRGTIRTFFGEVRSPLVNAPGTTASQKRTVRTTMLDMLADYGGTLKRLQDQDHIAICAHVEDRNELDTTKNRSIIVMSVKKEDIDQFTSKALTREEFNKRVDVLEY